MSIRFSVLIFLTSLSVALACTNFRMDLLDERLSDNFDQGVAAPADIDPAGTNSFSFVIMGDTHIGSPVGQVMRRVAQDISSRGDAFAIVAGDCSQGGIEGEFRQFKQNFADFGVVWRAAIGNHDIYFGGWQNFKREIGRSIYSFNADNVHFVILDSANGVLGERQLQWYEDDLSNNSRPITVVVTHFPPWIGQFSSIFKMSSEEEVAILKDINYRHGVTYFVSGHYHGFAEKMIGNTRYIVTGGANDFVDPGERQNYVRFTVNGNTISHQVNYY